MKLREKSKWFLSGLLVAVLISTLVTPAFAALKQKTIQVYNGVELYVDDVKLDTCDVNGNPVDVFVYNGTTYLPVRAVSKAFGKPVQWVGTNSVYIGKHTSDKPAVWLKNLDYFTGSTLWAENNVKDNLGNIYDEVLCNSGTNTYLLNGQYSAISGTLFQRYEWRSANSTSYIKIYGDDELLYRAEMSGGQMPVDFFVDLTGVLTLKIEYRVDSIYSGTEYAGIANCGLWT